MWRGGHREGTDRGYFIYISSCFYNSSTTVPQYEIQNTLAINILPSICGEATTTPVADAKSRPTKETHTVEMAARKPRGTRMSKQPRQNQHRQSSSKPKDKSSKKLYYENKFKSSLETRNCHSCGRFGHFARDCKTPEYFIKMYQELQRL
jgi:hypothetical protein